MAEKGNQEITIKLNRNDLWKYSTFLLLAVVVIGAIVVFAGGNDTNYNVGNSGQQQLEGNGDFSFAENEELYGFVGPKDAEVTVISFFDFQCGYCAIASGLSPAAAQYSTQYSDLYGVDGKVKELAEEGKIKLIYAVFAFQGAESVYAGEAVLCANEQNKYPEMHDVIFEAHDMAGNSGKYSKDNLKVLAKKVSGLNQNDFAECLDSGKYTSAVQQMASDTSSAGISGTPTYVVNGQIVSGSWAQISSVLSSLGVSA